MSDVSVRLNLFRTNEEISKKCGKIILAGSSLEDVIRTASSKYGEEIVELRTVQGAVIDDITLLRDWDCVIAVTREVAESESLLSSPQLAPDADSQSLHSIHSLHSVTSNTSSLDLRERGGDKPTVTTPTTNAVATASITSTNCKMLEPIDFGLRRTTSVSTPDAPSRNDWVRLNVGGKIFATTRATLTSDPSSMLARMFESGWASATDSTGAFLIDRSPEYFEPLLNFLRHNKLILNEGINPQGVLEEAKFFGISKAIEPLEALVQTEELALSGHFTRKEFLRMLSITSSSAILRCQGVNMEGVDLSNLDLRNINFKCANLHQCNLSNCDLSNCVFERADMSGANLDGAIIQCVHMPRVNLEGASLKGCTIDSRMGVHTNLEGANLKGAVCDNSQMNGINFRLASLKGSSLKSCNLRYAIMAGTDLENCDLTGCDLQHANLRGSNLAGAILEDIIAPLHMSQTVNVTTISIQGAGGQLQAAADPQPAAAVVGGGQGQAQPGSPTSPQRHQQQQQGGERRHHPGNEHQHHVPGQQVLPAGSEQASAQVQSQHQNS